MTAAMNGRWIISMNAINSCRRPDTSWGAVSPSYILQTRQPLLIRSVQDNTAFHEKHDLPKIGETAKSWLGVPLIVAGNITGVMGIQSLRA